MAAAEETFSQLYAFMTLLSHCCEQRRGICINLLHQTDKHIAQKALTLFVHARVSRFRRGETRGADKKL